MSPETVPTAAALAADGELGPRGTHAGDEDFEQLDVVDPDLFPIFEEEAAELMPQLGGALRQWTARPDNQSARMEALRALHTLKGSARLAGAMRLGDMAHAIESEIEQMGSHEPASVRIEPLLGRFDAMQAGFDALRRSNDVQAVQSTVAPIRPAQAVAAEEEALPRPGTPALPASPPGTGAVRILAPSASTAVARSASNQVVRVRSQLLDRMVNQAGEVMISRTRLEADLGQLRNSLGDLTGNLDRLRQQLRDIELQAESQMQTRLAQVKDSANGFDPLEFDRFTRVQELTRMMAESVNDVATVQRTLQRTVESTEDSLIAQARQTRDLQRDLLRTRMVEFDGISERLYRLVRQASKETAKQVRLDINGGSIELDRGVLERMTPAFEHLLRNCVAHGVEAPAARSAAGKDPTGQITIDLRQSGNDISVEFRDDGAGLDVAAIAAKALASGLVQPGHVVTPEEAASLIFMPGFSTASEVTELSGRGIGMDVVRSEVNALGGRIETVSDAGRGSRFTLVLPLTTAVTQVVMLRAGAASVGVPANLVESVRRATPRELQLAYNTGSFEYAGEQVPFYWSGALLQISARSEEAPARTIPVVVFRSAAQRLAMHVDEVLGNQEVVVKNLGPQLSRLPGLAGMTVLASGAVAMMYNPVALAAVYGEAARKLSADHAEPHVLGQGAGSAVPLGTDAASGSRIPLVMVVDDSITVRRVTQRLLLREGYRVVLAADGLQAIEKLQEERPVVVLSDIEMPRMDGFDLARNIRGDARLHDLPIVMITSRIAGKHRDHAMELGVNHYLGKPYSEDELLGLVRQYCASVPAAS
jgi:chemosensory pili system protein ChpA (sensor histidine kinase/response regulator)